ncbi:MAG: hypothetical protein IKN65_05635 [Clostridia bacterium]|nr:hypothetical protein [Clostridia bacterium]
MSNTKNNQHQTEKVPSNITECEPVKKTCTCCGDCKNCKRHKEKAGTNAKTE